MRTYMKAITVLLAVVFVSCSCIPIQAAGVAARSAGAGSRTVKADMAKVKVSGNMHINEIGYRTKDSKLLIASGGQGLFEIVDSKTGAPVYSGTLKKGPSDKASGDKVSYGDFTALEKPGEYCAYIPALGISYPFRISDTVYGDVKDALVKAFYYQRCGMALEAKYAGDWTHEACHTDKGLVYGTQDRLVDVSGGWHDAGDYGRYTVAGATAVADLLLAYDFFPESFKGDVNIPESGNNVPDILDETRYELEWLLKMQDAGSGGVYHKITTANFPSLNTLPEADFGQMILSPVSSTATGDFAAVTAMAARIYKPFDAAFAQKCLAAAQKAWEWLSKNKSAPGFKNPSGITTGEYGDNNDSDERYWAAAELYRTTGDTVYGDYVKKVYGNVDAYGPAFGWQNVSGFARVAYIGTVQNKRDSVVYSQIKSEIVNAADARLKTGKADGYRITLGPGDYYWGSNMSVLNDAMLLIITNSLSPKKDYISAAENNFDYILGCNSLSQCFLTGFGSKPVTDPHHRPSKADSVKDPVPGFVAGGPDKNLEDEVAAIRLKGKAPAKCYVDNSGSYSTNEVAIYWNSPAVFVAGYLDR